MSCVASHGPRDHIYICICTVTHKRAYTYVHIHVCMWQLEETCGHTAPQQPPPRRHMMPILYISHHVQLAENTDKKTRNRKEAQVFYRKIVILGAIVPKSSLERTHIFSNEKYRNPAWKTTPFLPRFYEYIYDSVFSTEARFSDFSAPKSRINQEKTLFFPVFDPERNYTGLHIHI